MKASSRLLSVVLALALILSSSACSAGTGTAAGEEPSGGGDSTNELFLPLTESTSKSLAFKLTEEQAAQVEKAGADRVT